MNIMKNLCMAALLVAVVASGAEAGRTKGGGGGVSTNYGCGTLKAGTLLTNATTGATKSLLMATSACYLCNMTTRVCAIQSPSTLVGWNFILP